MAKAVLRGDKQLRQNIKVLQEAFTGAAIDDAIYHALVPLVEETKKNARPLRDHAGKYPGFPDPREPRKGGHLDEGVVSRRVRGEKRIRVWWVSFTRRAKKLAHLVEFGTAPHFQPRFRRGFAHPGARPRPFFRPAFETSARSVLAKLRHQVEVRLLELAARLKK
jgi:hypothetical protein